MPTPSEQKALAFIAIAVLLGGAVRVVRANAAPVANAEEQQAIARQASAADSASHAKSAKRTRSSKGTGREVPPRVVAGIAGAPRTFARPDEPFSTSPYGFPPPSPRIDTDLRGAQAATQPTAAGKVTAATPSGTIDVDTATEAEIEKLPRIGPAMAHKIVANRDSLGPFKSLDALSRIKGMGPATLKMIAGHVSFSRR